MLSTHFRYRYILDGILPYIHNRWIVPSNIVSIHNDEYGIGKYHDADMKMLHVNFQILVDFVEIECAAMGNDCYDTPYHTVMGFLQGLPFIHWFLPSVRNARKGLHHLRWEMSLVDEAASQAEYAAQFYRLYRWWKRERPTRKDAWSVYQATRMPRLGEELSAKDRKLMKRCRQTEDRYEREDEQMLRLLLKYRKGLWT